MRIEERALSGPGVREHPARAGAPTRDELAGGRPGHARHASASRRARVVRFLRHPGEMVLAMMLGMVALAPLYRAGTAALGYADPSQQLPLLSAMVMTANMTVPMVAWMRYRGHGWARSGEMAAAMLGPALVLLALCVAGVLPHRSLSGAVMLVMLPAMLVAMLCRWDEYSGGHGH